jgi:hypothetical protein
MFWEKQGGRKEERAKGYSVVYVTDAHLEKNIHLFLVWHNIVKVMLSMAFLNTAFGGGGAVPIFLTSAIFRSDLSVSRPCRSGP